MVKTAELEEPDDDPQLLRNGQAAKTIRFDSSGVPELAKGKRRHVVQSELAVWYALLESERQTALGEAVNGATDWSLEALLHVSRQAYYTNSRKLFNLAFEAFSRRATPLLVSQAWGTAAQERQEQVQDILLHTFKAIRTGKADYAEINFASFAKRKSISLHRARVSRFEGSFDRVDPIEDADPIDHLTVDTSGPEERTLLARAFLARSIPKLEPKLRKVFIQKYVLGLTFEEIAVQHKVDESSIRNWLKQANAIVGLSGGEDDR
jgi:DNA-directed RNA polymerase specialized sigma24 family protein